MKNQLSKMSQTEIEDAFYQDLAFGTGGMRGILGPGTNRMNVLTVRRAAHGIATYIKSLGDEFVKKGFVIAFDNRRMSKEFSLEVASVLSTYEIPVYLYDAPRTTPQLSYSVRALGTAMGMMITASHNPPEYNGLKVYGSDGAQLNLKDAEDLVHIIYQMDAPERVMESEANTSFIQTINYKMDVAYQQEVTNVIFSKERLKETNLKVVFTPLHGASGETVASIAEQLQLQHFHYVEDQMKPDGEFPTVRSANPEEQDAFQLAIKKGTELEADVLIAVDPDGDRVGLAVWHEGGYQLLNGNETGALALNFLLSQHLENGTLPEDGMIFKTIVTSEMGRAIASTYGVDTENVLTGFKFIGEKIRENESARRFTYLFGYEESYGYLVKPFARDKDAVQMVFLLTEMAAYYKEQNLTLFDALQSLYKKVGVYKEKLISVTVPGASGAEVIAKALESVREDLPKEMANTTVEHVEDYLSQVRKSRENVNSISLPRANVIKFILEDETWVCLRPSGTEPKIKYYIGVKNDSLSKAEEHLLKVANWVESWMKVKLQS
ncbi:phospho-sugar mutase [Chryseomicrobium palamuruense]|uniref:Phosphoglucomutase n=1 Tax=Chryseomicrobium palamuruense TaxID=682973 RepID=A0ABV8UWV6_9BACL